MNASAAPAQDPARALLVDRLVDSFLVLLQERGWHDIALLDVVKGTQMEPAVGLAMMRSKGALLGAWIDRIDALMLAEGAPPSAEDARSRLFDVLMRRFDGLAAQRGALRALRRDLPADPLALLRLGLRLERSMALALELAGISSGGFFGMLRARTLVALEGSLLGTFLEDDSADLARTMAALDRRLRSLEPWANRLENMSFSRKTEPDPGSSAP